MLSSILSLEENQTSSYLCINAESNNYKIFKKWKQDGSIDIYSQNLWGM